jgi:hypothetical protein
MEMNKNLFLFFLFRPKQNEKNKKTNKKSTSHLSFLSSLSFILSAWNFSSYLLYFDLRMLHLPPSIPHTPSRPSPRVATTLLPVAALLLLQNKNKNKQSPLRLN